MAKKKNVVKVETRKDEVRYVTSDIKKMLGKFLVKSLKRTWSEAFADEGTREVVNKDEDKEETNRQFVVQTHTAERAIMLINRYLNDEQDKLEEECKEKNRGFDRKIIHASIEQSTIIPISQYIPKEFSLAYATEG